MGARVTAGTREEPCRSRGPRPRWKEETPAGSKYSQGQRLLSGLCAALGPAQGPALLFFKSKGHGGQGRGQLWGGHVPAGCHHAGG